MFTTIPTHSCAQPHNLLLTEQSYRARPRGALRHGRPLEASFSSVSYLPTRIIVPDVRACATATQDTPAAQPQEEPPVVDSGSEPADEAAIADYIISVQQCSTTKQLQKLVCTAQQKM